MGTWNSRGLRGSTLEELVNRANEQYREKHLALIQKVPTPITPIKIDKSTRHITLATLTRKVRWIISERCRAIPSVLMPRNAIPTIFPFRISMNIRCILWKILKNRAVLRLS